MDLCQYKNIFGEPNTGAHSYRIFNIAIVDLGLTILASYLIAKYYSMDFIYVFIIMMLIGLIMHKLFCVDTTLTKLVFE
jgi:hypothetical protein